MSGNGLAKVTGAGTGRGAAALLDVWPFFVVAADSAMVGGMVSFSLAILFKIVVEKFPAENRSCLLVTPRIKQVICFSCTKEAGSQEQEENKRSSRRKRGEKED
ncbi:hypothetical protein COLO4_30051 [Corchorus olitorius]|uniref:Uncharacterized protein n=1 Tax=Corchorus olitorius TaxID=93759 RepID=A0A1R3HBG5_9ROSI|nr:hypothetical protein COLO4_30051 [Corchorus olitorius]